LTNYLHTICRHAPPHGILSCWYMIFIPFISPTSQGHILPFCSVPAPVPLYLLRDALKAYRTVRVSLLMDDAS
uniref:hypothetical protein n=1 Tax=Prevotella sp. TaxID=59823 RepID=UPI004028A072